MQTLHVNLPASRYPLHIGAGALAEKLPGLVAQVAQELVVVITNDTLVRLYPGRIEAVLREAVLQGSGLRVETIVLPDGERYKTLATLSHVYDRLMEWQANRKTTLLAFGGGVIGDLAGFAAATFMRGVPLIQVPTTLLAQVDSSVGGKTAVNHPLGKNAIGAFSQPRGVVMDLELLGSLPEREFHAGLCELIKHGIIRDRALFDDLARRPLQLASADWTFWEDVIARSCRVKIQVVEADEKEQHERALLNFGHTLGHLIETHTGYEACLHGEAVGIGMIFAAFCSREWGLLPEADFQHIVSVLEPLLNHAAAPISLPQLDEPGFSALILHDKKAAQNTVRFIVLEGLGRASIRERTRPDELWPLFQRFVQRWPGLLDLQAA